MLSSISVVLPIVVATSDFQDIQMFELCCAQEEAAQENGQIALASSAAQSIHGYDGSGSLRIWFSQRFTLNTKDGGFTVTPVK